MFEKNSIAYYYEYESKLGVCRARMLDKPDPKTGTIEVQLYPIGTPILTKHVNVTKLYPSYEIACHTAQFDTLMRTIPEEIRNQYNSEIFDGIDDTETLILWLYAQIDDPNKKAIAAYVIENTTGRHPDA